MLSARFCTHRRASRASPCSIAHLGDREHVFVLAAQPGLELDARPPAPPAARLALHRRILVTTAQRQSAVKLPLLTMLKQARAFPRRRGSGDANPVGSTTRALSTPGRRLSGAYRPERPARLLELGRALLRDQAGASIAAQWNKRSPGWVAASSC